MATRTVTLNADGIAEREVMYVRYELNQQTDVEGQPTGTTRGGKIYLKVKSNDDGNSDLMEWMYEQKWHHLLPKSSRWRNEAPFFQGRLYG